MISVCLCIRRTKNKGGGKNNAVPVRKHKRNSLKQFVPDCLSVDWKTSQYLLKVLNHSLKKYPTRSCGVNLCSIWGESLRSNAHDEEGNRCIIPCTQV